MSSITKVSKGFHDFRELPPGPKRREAVRDYLLRHRGISSRVADLAGVTGAMVSKVLHGSAKSAKVDRALEIEERKSAAAA